MDFDPRHFLIKDRATFSQGIPRPGTCTFDLNATPEEIFAVMGKSPAPFMKRTKQGVYIELQPRDVHVSIDAGRACAGVGTPEEEYMELDHLQMVNFGVGFHVPRVANTDEPEQVAINLQLILHEPGEALPFVLVEMYRYKDNSANIQIETLSGIQVQEPITTHGAFVEFQADQRANRFRILFDGVEKWSTTYRAKVSPRFAVGVRAGTKIRIADSARIMLVTAPEQFSFKVPRPWRSICERPRELPAPPADHLGAPLGIFGRGRIFAGVEETRIFVGVQDSLGSPLTLFSKRVMSAEVLMTQNPEYLLSESLGRELQIVGRGTIQSEIKKVIE